MNSLFRTNDMAHLTPYAEVESRIVVVRQQPVLLDMDVAALYGVETKRVNEAVRNNPDKFPNDYMFELDADESQALRSKISTLKQSGKGRHSKYNYKAFTEKGLYMLATVLKGRRAIDATFAIIETFAKVRSLKRGTGRVAQGKRPQEADSENAPFRRGAGRHRDAGSRYRRDRIFA